ncbi:MAG: NTP transferase domain-containing protein [Gemmatimonadaceae bacterium]
MIAGLLLASGASRRFGSNKLVAPLGDRAVVRWSAEALASAVDDAWVVVAGHSVDVRTALHGLRVRWVENPAAHEGMASSIRAGIAALPTEAEGVAITLGDQPLIDRDVIRRVVARWRDSQPRPSAVVAAYQDGRGHPVLFGATLFPALLTLDGDRGARELLASLGEGVAIVPVTGARPPDVDTPEELAALARGDRENR